MIAYVVSGIPHKSKEHNSKLNKAMAIIEEFIDSDAEYVKVADDEGDFYTTNDMRRTFQSVIESHNIENIKTYLRNGECYLGKVKK